MSIIPKTLARRLAHLAAPKRQFYSAAAVAGGAMGLPTGDRLAERIRGLNPPRLNLDGIVPPRRPPEGAGISAAEVRKVVWAAKMEAARERMRAAPASVVSYAEFVGICGEEGIAKALDESGAVVVLGDAVFLRPQEIAKAIENMIPGSPNRQNELQRRELEEMEEKKAEIDSKAISQVRTELWCGLGYLVAQTAAFMRLTFWELSWDVMEPICFYVTSTYFMAGYAFFLRTAKEPSFESFFQSRFATKQLRLMKAEKFDIDRYNQLRQAFSRASLRNQQFASNSHCHCSSKSPCLH